MGSEDTFKAHNEELNGNRRLINQVKKAGIECYNPDGPYNGYGYTRLPMVAKIKTPEEQALFNQIRENLKKTAPPAMKTQEQIIQSWAKRLVKLLPEEEIDLEDAIAIAHEKIEYKEKQIADLEARQQEQMRTSGRTSIKREKLINEIERSNPLRWIKDEAHARRILAAHYRHTDTAYDFELEELHELEERGVIERGNARELARTRISGIKQDE